MSDLLDLHEWWCAGGAPGCEEDEPCAGSGCDARRLLFAIFAGQKGDA